MLRSMTGFGAAQSSGEVAGNEALLVRAEVRSVNHRHLLVKTRVPGELTHVEPDIEALVKKRLARGTVTVHVATERAGGEMPAAIDRAAARAYAEELRALAGELNLAEGPTLADVLALPGVVVPGREGGAREGGEVVLAAVGGALDELVVMRDREGAALAADLAKHAAAIEVCVAKIEVRMPEVARQALDALRKRTDELLEGRRGPVTEDELARELALIADRTDVSEELARLASHIAQLRELIERGGAIGRKLDFLVQEMFREANTIGSKCSDARAAQWVVETKSHLERVREQVQNVE